MLQRLADAVWSAGRGLLTAVLPSGLLAALRRYKGRRFRYEVILADGARFMYRPTDVCIVEEVYTQRVYGPPELYAPGQVVFDVGGHIGAFAVFAARRVGREGRVVVCEPAPDTLSLLRRNVEDLPQVRLHETAVSDKEGSIVLRLAENPAANSIFGEEGEPVTVPLTTLDAVHAAEGSPAVDHLKIDVEGAELGVLRGGAKTLAATRRVVMETHPGRAEPAEAAALLEKAGFRVRVDGRFLEAVKVPQL